MVSNITKESNVIISFLGNSNYNDVNYKFGDKGEEVYAASYTSVAYKYHLENLKRAVNRFVIFGTAESKWKGFVENAYKLFANKSEAKQDSCEFYKELAKKLPDGKVTREELNSLTNELNSYVKSIGENLEFNFELHDTNITSEAINSSCAQIFKRISYYIKLSEKTNLYLDITNGFRIIPMLAFFAIESVVLLNSKVSLKAIFYGQTVDSAVGTKVGPDRELFSQANNVVRKLLGAARVCDEVTFNNLIVKATELIGKPGARTRIDTYDVCTLKGCDKITQQAMDISCYDVSADINFIGNYVENNKKHLWEIADYESFSKNNAAIETARKLGNIDCQKQLIGGVRDRLNEHLAILKNESDIDALKALAVLQYEKHNYFRAINTLASTVECEFGGDSKQQTYNNIQRKMGNKFCENYKKYVIDLHRAMIVHMEDKESIRNNKEAKLNKFLMEDKYYQVLKDFMISYGCIFHDTNKVNSRKNSTLLSFIGSGSYDIMDYNFTSMGEATKKRSFYRERYCR